jgi:hypothetical protein
MTGLEKMLADVSGHWTYEDGIYRMYHQSFKVFYLQGWTTKMVLLFEFLMPQVPLNKNFLKIIADGTGHTFNMEHNKDWLKNVRPIVEAFLHAKFMLEMMIKYGKEFEVAPHSLPSGWAAVLYLYNTR